MSPQRIATTVFILCLSVLQSWAARAGSPSSEGMNAANNPLQPTIGVNLQDQYIERYYGLGDADSNAFLLRGTLPHKLFDMPQIMRLTIPVVTSPELPAVGQDSGLGDLNLFDIFLTKVGRLELGLGPQLTVPTANHDTLGSGKWQVGVAAVAIAPQEWGLLGELLTWQHSFAGESDRPTQNNLMAQPFVMVNLPSAFYFRSTATWTWDLHRGTHYIPVGAGLGRVWNLGTTVLNLFAEPQWTIAHHGDGVPAFQIYAGVNLQFPISGQAKRSPP